MAKTSAFACAATKFNTATHANVTRRKAVRMLRRQSDSKAGTPRQTSMTARTMGSAMGTQISFSATSRREPCVNSAKPERIASQLHNPRHLSQIWKEKKADRKVSWLGDVD
eukprot:scaffold106983_cov35-Tisochrysis_lutea.AAC.3